MKTLPEYKLRVAVIGAGPVGLALALLAARQLPGAQVTLFDARPADRDVAADPRTLALSLGSIQLLQRLDAWDGAQAEPIREVWVSQQSPVLAVPRWLGSPQVQLSAIDLAVSMLGAGDAVLIAGKGHETGQVIKGVTHPFSDQDVARAALSQA